MNYTFRISFPETSKMTAIETVSNNELFDLMYFKTNTFHHNPGCKWAMDK
jgi:hypothetical protein